METVSILKFNKMPEIKTHIFHAEINSLIGTHKFNSDGFCHMFVVISGSISYRVSDSGKWRSGKSLSANHVLVLPPEDELEITVSTQHCQLLYIAFDLLATDEIYDYYKNDYEHSFKYKKLRLLRESVSPLNFEDRFPYFISDIHNLILHCKSAPNDFYGLAFPLETVLYTILKIQLSATINVLRSVKAVAVSSEDYLFKTPFTYCISDISIWTHSKNNKPKSEEICKFLTKHNFTELPNNKKDYIGKIKKSEDGEAWSYYEFTLIDSGKFKLWLFPGKELPSLEDYKSTGVICFRFKTSQPGNYIFSLYHTPSYQRIRYSFEIKTADEWTDVEIPISKNSALNILLPYIEKAVQYIQDNYAEKITIQDIADHVRIHPSYLSSIFRKSLNQSVNSYINFHRINIAKQLLRNGDTSITDIALQTGFYDAQHFLKTFKKNTGFTPSEYRNM